MDQPDGAGSRRQRADAALLRAARAAAEAAAPRIGLSRVPADAVRIVRFIKRAQELGFSLDEVEELVRLRGVRRGDRHSVRAIAERKIADIDRKIAHLQSMRAALRAAGRVVPSRRRRGVPDHRGAERRRRADVMALDPVCGMTVDPGARRRPGRARRHDVLLLLEGLRREVHAPIRRSICRARASRCGMRRARGAADRRPEEARRSRPAPAPRLSTSQPLSTRRRVRLPDGSRGGERRPGACPMCGMALEPRVPNLDATRRTPSSST